MQRRWIVFGALVGGLPLAVWALRSGDLTPADPVGPGAYHGRATEEPCEPGAALCFFALGDTGEATRARAQVVDTMTQWVARLPPSFVLLLGDNFYPHGVTSKDSPRFDVDFERAFPADRFPVPFHIVLGNHDYHGSIEAELAYVSPTRRWDLPARHYQRSATAPDGATLDLFVLDTQPLVNSAPEAPAQLAWLAEALAASQADWQIVAGHHPVFSGGGHGGSLVLQRQLLPVLRDGGADLYLCGHDHDLQVLEPQGGPLLVVSGAGSLHRRAGRTRETLYCESAPGFARVLVDRDRICVTMVTHDGVRDERHVVRAERAH